MTEYIVTVDASGTIQSSRPYVPQSQAVEYITLGLVVILVLLQAVSTFNEERKLQKND